MDKFLKSVQGSRSWYFFRRNLEAWIWLTALLALAFTDPSCDHLSLCPLKNMGFHFCPGCGLGHSISWFFRGEIIKSVEAHPLGIFAIILLTYRIFTVFNNYRKELIIQKT